MLRAWGAEAVTVAGSAALAVVLLSASPPVRMPALRVRARKRLGVDVCRILTSYYITGFRTLAALAASSANISIDNQNVLCFTTMLTGGPVSLAW